MTVSSTTNRKAFTGDAVTTSFGTSPVVFFETSELVVQAVVTATGVTTTLVENSPAITASAPRRVRAMPSNRRRLSRSRKIRNDNTVVIGTMSWLTIATEDGLAVFSARKTKANDPAPMHNATRISRQNGFGAGRSHGKTAMATIAQRTAA